MKRYYLTIVFLSLTTLGVLHAQKNRCQTKTDAFDQQVITSYHWSEWFYIEHKAGIIKAELEYAYSGVLDVVQSTGTELMFKTENNEVIKVYTSTDSQPTVKHFGGGKTVVIKTYYRYTFVLNKEDLKKLANSVVNLIRFPDPVGGFKDLEAKGYIKKYVNAITDGAKCIQAIFN